MLYHPTSYIDFQPIYLLGMQKKPGKLFSAWQPKDSTCLMDFSFDPIYFIGCNLAPSSYSETTKCPLAENARLSDEIFEEAVVSLRCRCRERACCSIRLGSIHGDNGGDGGGEEQFRAPLG